MTRDPGPASQNFAFLGQHDPVLLRLCAAAERNFPDDPNTTVVKLRQFSELVVRTIAAMVGVERTPETTTADLLRELQVRSILDRTALDLFHHLRREGNRAVHEYETTPQQAKDALRIARQLAIWFHRATGKADPRTFQPGPFVEPPRRDHEARVTELSSALALKAEEARAAYQIADAERLQRQAAEARAASAEEERALWTELARSEEEERKRAIAEYETVLSALQAEAQARPAPAAAAVEQAVQAASRAIALDEAETRAIIDVQLTEAGWQADSENLSYSNGARPEAGKCKAIAEWPTASGPADYVLFDGLVPVGVVEAKKYGLEVAGVVPQAERYSLGYEIKAGEMLPRPPDQAGPFPGWLASHEPEAANRHFRIPFVFTANGRPYFRQMETKSGIWFRDVRRPTNHPRPLADWHTPEALRKLLESEPAHAEAKLQAEPFGYLNLRDYQVKAVQAVESRIAGGGRECLVAMATGTGKTRTIVGLIYRLLKTKRFNRVLFLVDRNSLGTQAQDTFKDMRLEQNRTFAEIYEVMELADITPDGATKVHVATVQGMVRRLFGDELDIPIDRYDCIVVDEAHRGYILDREMGEGELAIRSEADYISSYRRVLDYFDAVKVALTATPAQHTVEIFGRPVYTYTYREAVIDGWLIDHDPPVRIITQLAEKGIHFDKGETVQVVQSATGGVDTATLPDELDFDIDGFNRLVITENFNRIVCEELAKQLDDPSDKKKTLIYAANDNHADLVVSLLKTALEGVWGPIDDKTVMKITGRTDKPEQAIKRFKNERLPVIAVTVDLLTTGIDVPEICNLVFLRRVRSRILYEQMLGRATRLCPEIDKEVFRIFDAVDIYNALEPVNTMKPVVQSVAIPLAQLFAEIADEKSHQAPGSGEGRSHADDVRDQIVVRVRKLIQRALRNAADHPELRDAIERLEQIAGLGARELPETWKAMDAESLGAFVRAHPALLSALQNLQLGGNGGIGQVVSTHDDDLVSVQHGYGSAKRPEDYLDSFRRFIEENRNQIAALQIAVTRPRDLTRGDLRKLQIALAEQNFDQKTIQSAWREAKNEEIAASIIGYIRQLAIGSPLIPFEARVDRAVKKILASRSWSLPQQKWLERIAKEMKRSIVIDETTFEEGAFQSAGGFRNLQQVFGTDAQAVLGDIAEAVWEDAA